MAEFQVSIEEHIKRFNCDKMIQDLLALDSTSSHQVDYSSSENTCIPYDGADLIDPQNYDVGKNEFDIYFPMLDKSKGNTFDPSNYLVLDNDLLPHDTHIKREPSLQSGYVILSESVGVTLPKKFGNTSGPIQIVHDLEVNYKPRYKSDYFSQHGNIRPPRYVADRLNNHYVSIRVIPGLKGYLRIDWVTIPDGQGMSYSMPYKFQKDNDSIEVPDENPTYRKIEADSSGLIKIYLVLIKSKQGELTSAQPLQLFPPVLQSPNTDMPVKTVRPSPKQLIQQYKLDQSQLAFTYCRPGPDETTCIPDWSTTVYSTIITERADESAKKRKVNCPQCQHSFEITTDTADDGGQEKIFKRPKT